MTEADIIKVLYSHFNALSGEWLCFDHFRMGTGWCCERTVDFFALKAWQPYTALGFEIKTSLSDLSRENSHPEKRMAAVVLFHEHIIVTPEGLLSHGVHAKGFPADCGLWEVSAEGALKKTFRNKRTPPERLVSPGWPFVAALARRVLKADKSKED